MNGVIRRIKSRGYDVLIKEDYDTARYYITDLFKDCDDGFKDAGFTVPERIKDGEIAIADGYQIIEGYYGGNYSYKNIKKGDELRATNSRQYELITYGEHDDDAIGEILERINNVWDSEYYAVEVVGLEGESLDYLVGVELDDVKGSKLRVIDQIIGYGIEIPEEMLEGLKKQKRKYYNMIEDLRDLLDLVKDKQFIKDMEYKLRHAKRDSEVRGEILGEYLYELESEIVEQLVKEGMFTINDNLVMTYKYNEHRDEYTFYNQNDKVISTITGKISNHDQLEEEDPEGDKLYLELGKIFGDPIQKAN